MKDFLAVFDGLRVSKSTLQYGVELAANANAHLTGVFLDDVIYRSYNVSEVLRTMPDSKKAMAVLDAKDKKKRDEAALWFQAACEKARANFSIHRDKNIALQDLKHDSMFADLVILNKHETFTKYREQSPTRFVKNLLADVQSPVMMVPDRYQPLDNITLLYDGQPSSLHAIKMFVYLFGNLNLPVEVFTVNDYFMANLRLPDNKLMRTFIRRHFPNAIFTITKGDAKEQMLEHLKGSTENRLIVLGAYQRSDLSRWFKVSMADILMKECNAALFIAHSK
ncbi:MAG: universal stress protein [Agriterribacter sp.]